LFVNTKTYCSRTTRWRPWLRTEPRAPARGFERLFDRLRCLPNASLTMSLPRARRHQTVGSMRGGWPDFRLQSWEIALRFWRFGCPHSRVAHCEIGGVSGARGRDANLHRRVGRRPRAHAIEKIS